MTRKEQLIKRVGQWFVGEYVLWNYKRDEDPIITLGDLWRIIGYTHHQLNAELWYCLEYSDFDFPCLNWDEYEIQVELEDGSKLDVSGVINLCSSYNFERGC